MITFVAFFLFASTTNVHSAQISSAAANSSTMYPASVDAPKSPYALTLYNQKGEVVAQCGMKDGRLSGCKMEPGVTLDDLMNAWVRAYLDVQK